MPVTLDSPIDVDNANADTKAMLDALQPNIIKPHVRDVLTVLFMRFSQPTGAKAFLKALASAKFKGTKPLMKSASRHLVEIAAFKANGTKGTPYVSLGLTAAGYTALGTAAGRTPDDASFRGGMQAAGLGDRPVAEWDEVFRQPIHAAILIGDAERGPHDAALAKVQSLIASAAGVAVAGTQDGLGLHNSNGDGIEHFGYVDGRSQPLFLKADIDREQDRTDGTSVWNPAFAPSRVIVADPAAPNPAQHFGSYFVFRKLEQDVKAFKLAEEQLADDLGLTGDDAERAGAMLVGRFEDGTPVALQSEAGSHKPVQNDFNYTSDPHGGKCPYFAHIRKVNPRGSGGFEQEPQERLHIMARRGQTYGLRADNPNDGATDNKPEGNVGLLFMAFNVKIADQFEFAQKAWANFPGFPKVKSVNAATHIPHGQPGLDPIIGQGARGNAEFPLDWGAQPDRVGTALNKRRTKSVAQVAEAVRMKGGEYFFMPSLATLLNAPTRL
jgi:Dyp-type peroxidase family